MNNKLQVQLLILMVCITFVAMIAFDLYQQYTIEKHGPIIYGLQVSKDDIIRSLSDKTDTAWIIGEAESINREQRQVWEELRKIHPDLSPWPKMEIRNHSSVESVADDIISELQERNP